MTAHISAFDLIVNKQVSPYTKERSLKIARRRAKNKLARASRRANRK